MLLLFLAALSTPLVAVPTAQTPKPSVFVQYDHGDKSENADRLVFALKERIRASAGYQLATVQSTASLSVHLTPVDIPNCGQGTAIGLSFTKPDQRLLATSIIVTSPKAIDGSAADILMQVDRVLTALQ
jgi:hypothetical protein